MSETTIDVDLDDDILDRIDEQVDRGRFESREAFIEWATREFIHEEDVLIADGVTCESGEER